MAALKNPFPGMDPFLELEWDHVHHYLASEAGIQIDQQLGDTELRTRVERRLILEDPQGDIRFIKPDVVTLEEPADDAGGTATLVAPAGTALLTRPAVEVGDEPETQPYLEIRTVPGDKVITVIEFVSPTNKRAGDGRNQYLSKREECHAGGVNFVEIDLTRQGRRTLPPALAAHAEAEATYVAAIHRHHPRPTWQLYPMPLREPLANLPIPLRPADADVPLMLGPLVERVREVSRMRPSDYRRPLTPPLNEDDAAWVAARLAGVL
jgi:hypothetical protein